MLQQKILNTALSAFDAFKRYSIYMCDKMLWKQKINMTFW